MSIGPRLDLRQSQTLVMTPQLRQAIKLLQFSNIEAGAFVEEELERNPLLERDERYDSATSERPAPDQVVLPNGHVADTAEMATSETAGRGRLAAGYGRCGNLRRRRRGRRRRGAPPPASPDRHGGGADFSDDDRSIEDLAEPRRNLREHLGEQLRLNFDDPVDRIIGAHLIALLARPGG